MNWLALAMAAALASSPPPTLPPPWRVIDRAGVHVGVRPAALLGRDEAAFGITLQVTASVP